jgi:hypothetical protein
MRGPALGLWFVTEQNVTIIDFDVGRTESTKSDFRAGTVVFIRVSMHTKDCSVHHENLSSATCLIDHPVFA